MGETFYVVADETTRKNKRTFRYVTFGKQTELYINHKSLLAAFILIKDSCDSFACDIKFINGSDNFEIEVMKAFGPKWKEHITDVSKEYEKYAVEELEPDSNWAIVKRLYETLSQICEAQKDQTLTSEHRVILQIKYNLIKYMIDGIEPKKYPFKRDSQTCSNCKKQVLGISYYGESSYCRVKECSFEKIR